MLAIVVTALGSGCTQETQHRIGRGIQNWTGTNALLDVYAGDKLVMRFIEIDKLTTAGLPAGMRRVRTAMGTGLLISTSISRRIPARSGCISR